ncbi:hypothetical protein BCR42DRAFT_414008 [Absidia repens]|uniref:SET domain-containing protein n=1 Tax=Absidia repens TaxID=90262 RepID=A0A1X2III0_9FUNG|nr:hypothetical protein BCR42DRAFT_414008 [Absidia repens]
MTDWEADYDFETVINRNEFIDTVEIKECETVGRSLVARRSISRGDIVLVESPLLQYFLEPTCRSSLSPFYTKQLWKTMKEIVQSEDPSIEQRTTTTTDDKSHSSYYSDDDEESDYSNDDDESDTSDDDHSTPNSSFNPGVPAAMLAFLQLYPPPAKSHVTDSAHFQRAQPPDFDFFYYPSTEMEHSTVQLVCRSAKRVVQEIDLYRHVDPELLSTFILKIYGNAHTVALDRKANHRSKLTTLTHSKKHHRRQTIYAHRNEDNQQDNDNDDNGAAVTTTTSWGSSSTGPRPSIALMLWGSKFSHACSPNLLLQYDPPTNTMVFVATRAISAGEVLTFSYLPEDESLGGLVCGSTEGRRAKLQQFKFFDCACDRCQGRDGSRGADCPERCISAASTWYQGSTRTWECEQCHSTARPSFVLPEMEKGESYVERMVTGMATKVRNGANGGGGPSNSVVHMMETYLNNLLQRGHNQGDSDDDNDGGDVVAAAAIPQHHWTFGYIHGLLAIYHVELFPRTFGKGLASQLGLTETGFKEARIYIVDFLHKRLWSSNPVPAFFAAWHVLSPVIQAVMDGTEEKQYFVPVKKTKASRRQVTATSDDDTDSSSDSDDEPPVMLDPLVIAMPVEWNAYITDMADVVTNQWVPVIKEIFAGRSSVVVDDMMHQIQKWSNRVNECKALA